MAKFKFSTGVNKAYENTVEIPDEELNSCETEEDKEEFIDKWFDEWVWQQIEGHTYWKELKD